MRSMSKIKWDEADISEEEERAVRDTVRSGYVGGNGPQVKEFEKKFAAKVQAKYAIATNNGTSALLCALQALKRNQEIRVGVPTFTFIASVNTSAKEAKAIHLLDCDLRTWNIRKAFCHGLFNILMAVDVGGLPCPYNELGELGHPIIADSAESVGAYYQGKPIGSQGDIHCFSFHRAKIITTGEGGMITTSHKALYEYMYQLTNHGYDPKRKPWEYKHSERAFNYRMMELQAAIGLVQLKKLDRYVKERQEKAKIYKDIIGCKAGYQFTPKDCLHPYFFFGMLIDSQEEFCKKMYSKGIEVKTWTPVHKQPIYSTKRSYPNADYIAERIVLLPIHNKLNEEDVKYIAEQARSLL